MVDVPLRDVQGEASGNRTEIQHIVFGIAASSKLWQQRKEYIKIWYRPKQMRGVVWLDNRVKYTAEDRQMLPPVRILNDSSKFPYTNRKGHRSAIRISRIVSETLHLKQENVRWFVMGDNDTVFITENLVRVLNKYDHNQFYYIGSLSGPTCRTYISRMAWRMAAADSLSTALWQRHSQRCRTVYSEVPWIVRLR
ncbi:hypothetical protein SLEP1_g59167 [Rubroshorea leprosula]|uniref:Fringe-like glycosyltransferase domain-containing protein n=1 Tax=Rubroshorea leprosula TaxID=152421 RepID=A0AAV5MRK1_9ROSI|nr:hypothetical protein SLEP1_g59167 [Rubroshorea leprosula]